MAEGSEEVRRKFPLKAGETKGISIEDDETVELRAMGLRCLVGKLGVNKKLNKEAFKSLLNRIWRTEGRLFIKEIHEQLWLFEFAEEEDKKRVMEGHPWSFDRTLLVLKEFEAKTPPNHMVFNHTPICIQIHGMPLGCMNRRSEPR
jgi:hypothetical protein